MVLFCLAPIFLWSFCVDVCSPVCTVVGLFSVLFLSSVCVLCLAAHLRQWAVDVFEAVRRPSSAPLQFMRALSLPYPVVCRPRPHVLHVPERVVVGVCRLGWVVHLNVVLSLLLSMSVHRVFHPVRRSVVFLHAVWLRVVLPWRDIVLDCSGCNRPVCPRPVLLLCADC